MDPILYTRDYNSVVRFLDPHPVSALVAAPPPPPRQEFKSRVPLPGIYFFLNDSLE